MKRAIILSVAWLAINCGPDPGPTFRYSYTVKNEANFSVTLSCAECVTVYLNPQETEKLHTNTVFSEYHIDGGNDWVIEYEETTADSFTITAYQYELRYSISGSARNVEVTFIDDQGAVQSYPNVEPGPSGNYKFKHFPGDHAELTAKIISTVSGDVRLYIIHKDKIIKEDSGEGYGTMVSVTATLE